MCGDDRESFSTLTGIALSTIGNYERGDRVPDADMIWRYREASGISADWILGGGSQTPTPIGGVKKLQSLDRMIRLPIYSEVMASAGPGSTPASEVADGILALDRRFLRDQGAVPEQCAVIWARGDSMMPTIPDGSALVVDRSQLEIADGCIMVLNVGGSLLVKRVQRLISGDVRLVSDNRDYESETLSPHMLDQVRVVGRVVYFGRTP